MISLAGIKLANFTLIKPARSPSRIHWIILTCILNQIWGFSTYCNPIIRPVWCPGHHLPQCSATVHTPTTPRQRRSSNHVCSFWQRSGLGGRHIHVSNIGLQLLDLIDVRLLPFDWLYLGDKWLLIHKPCHSAAAEPWLMAQTHLGSYYHTTLLLVLLNWYTLGGAV